MSEYEVVFQFNSLYLDNVPTGQLIQVQGAYIDGTNAFIPTDLQPALIEGFPAVIFRERILVQDIKVDVFEIYFYFFAYDPKTGQTTSLSQQGSGSSSAGPYQQARNQEGEPNILQFNWYFNSQVSNGQISITYFAESAMMTRINDERMQIDTSSGRDLQPIGPYNPEEVIQKLKEKGYELTPEELKEFSQADFKDKFQDDISRAVFTQLHLGVFGEKGSFTTLMQYLQPFPTLEAFKQHVEMTNNNFSFFNQNPFDLFGYWNRVEAAIIAKNVLSSDPHNKRYAKLGVTITDPYQGTSFATPISLEQQFLSNPYLKEMYDQLLPDIYELLHNKEKKTTGFNPAFDKIDNIYTLTFPEFQQLAQYSETYEKIPREAGLVFEFRYVIDQIINKSVFDIERFKDLADINENMPLYSEFFPIMKMLIEKPPVFTLTEEGELLDAICQSQEIQQILSNFEDMSLLEISQLLGEGVFTVGDWVHFAYFPSQNTLLHSLYNEGPQAFINHPWVAVLSLVELFGGYKVIYNGAKSLLNVRHIATVSNVNELVRQQMSLQRNADLWRSAGFANSLSQLYQANPNGLPNNFQFLGQSIPRSVDWYQLRNRAVPRVDIMIRNQVNQFGNEMNHLNQLLQRDMEQLRQFRVADESLWNRMQYGVQNLPYTVLSYYKDLIGNPILPRGQELAIPHLNQADRFAQQLFNEIYRIFMGPAEMGVYMAENLSQSLADMSWDAQARGYQYFSQILGQLSMKTGLLIPIVANSGYALTLLMGMLNQNQNQDNSSQDIQNLLKQPSKFNQTFQTYQNNTQQNFIQVLDTLPAEKQIEVIQAVEVLADYCDSNQGQKVKINILDNINKWIDNVVPFMYEIVNQQSQTRDFAKKLENDYSSRGLTNLLSQQIKERQTMPTLNPNSTVGDVIQALYLSKEERQRLKRAQHIQKHFQPIEVPLSMFNNPVENPQTYMLKGPNYHYLNNIKIPKKAQQNTSQKTLRFLGKRSRMMQNQINPNFYLDDKDNIGIQTRKRSRLIAMENPNFFQNEFQTSSPEYQGRLKKIEQLQNYGSYMNKFGNLMFI